MLEGKRTIIIGIVMIVHGIASVVLDYLNSGTFNQMGANEALMGLGFIFLRKAI